MSHDAGRTTVDTDLIGQRLLFDDPQNAATDRVDGRRRRRRATQVLAIERQTSNDSDGNGNSISAILTAIDGIVARLAALESAIMAIRDELHVRQTVKEFYTTAEIAQLLGRRPYTVREWCRLGRINAEKAHSGRGLDEEWRVGHEELVRIQNEGLLAIQKHAHVAAPRRLPK